MKRIVIYIIPWFFLLLFDYSSGEGSYYLSAPNSKRVYLGLENFIDNYALEYKGKRAVVVTNHSGVNFCLERNIDLIRNKHIEIAFVLAPEHGIYGYQNEYAENMYNVDDRLNIIIYNLHHLNSKTLKHLLKIVEIVIFDIQDMGMRCYTYVSSLKLIIDTLDGSDIELIILDRPNPLGFLGVNGSDLEESFTSRHISAFPVPLLYNLTIGEAALYYKGEFNKNLKMRVVPLLGYKREMFFNETKLPWVPPSPNLPTYESSIVYSAMVLLEGINISLGRGTTKPFEYIGAPWIEPDSFCNGLKKLNLKNFRFRPIYFKPTFSKYMTERCGGVQIFYIGKSFDPSSVSYNIIKYIRENYEEFEWESYKGFINLDYLAGTDKFRKAIEDGKDFMTFLKDIRSGIEVFEKKRVKYFIYD